MCGVPFGETLGDIVSVELEVEPPLEESCSYLRVPATAGVVVVQPPLHWEEVEQRPVLFRGVGIGVVDRDKYVFQ